MKSSSTIKMVDLNGQYLRIKDEIDDGIRKTIKSSAFINGPAVREFRENLGRYLGGIDVIPCANGTDALQIALMALGLKPGDEVIVPAFTYVSSAEIIALLGLTPVMVDVDPRTFNVTVGNIRKALTSKTKAIIPVHLFGQSCDMEPIMEFAAGHGLYVIEDNAQALGADYCFSDGHRAMTGTIGDIGCTSFFPSKNLGCYGDGGAIFCKDKELAGKIAMIANHGQKIKYHHSVIGCNSRLDTIQAAVLLAKLEIFDKEIQMRNEVANFYSESLKDICITPYIPEGNLHVYAQYTVRIKERNKVQTELGKQGIPTVTHYSRCIHEQPAFAYLGYKPEDFPVALQTSREILCLPMSPYLKREDQEKIINAIKRI